MNDPLFEKVARIMARTFHSPLAEIHPELARGHLPGWDSVGHITLIMEIENEFDVRFPTDKINDLDTVTRICDALKQVKPNL